MSNENNTSLADLQTITNTAEKEGQDNNDIDKDIDNDIDKDTNNDIDKDTNDANAEDHDDDVDSNEQGKKKTGFEKRLKKLSKRITDAEQTAKYWKEQAEIANNNNNNNNVSKPVISNKPLLHQYKNVEEYTEALTDWKIRDKSEKDNAKATWDAYQKRQKSFSDKTPDFQEFVGRTNAWPANPDIHKFLIESDHGPELLYRLAQDKEEFDRINSLSPMKRAAELGKLEGKIERRINKEKESGNNNTTSNTTSNNKSGNNNNNKTTKAPAPLETRNSNPKLNNKSLSDDSLNYADWKKLRMDQLKNKPKLHGGKI